MGEQVEERIRALLADPLLGGDVTPQHQACDVERLLCAQQHPQPHASCPCVLVLGAHGLLHFHVPLRGATASLPVRELRWAVQREVGLRGMCALRWRHVWRHHTLAVHVWNDGHPQGSTPRKTLRAHALLRKTLLLLPPPSNHHHTQGADACVLRLREEARGGRPSRTHTHTDQRTLWVRVVRWQWRTRQRRRPHRHRHRHRHPHDDRGGRTHHTTV